MSKYPDCDHYWDIEGHTEKLLFCAKCGMHFDTAQYISTLQEKARAAVNAPYEDILDMGLAQALRELEEVLPPQ